jgi:hypothetical protein
MSKRPISYSAYLLASASRTDLYRPFNPESERV